MSKYQDPKFDKKVYRERREQGYRGQLPTTAKEFRREERIFNRIGKRKKK